MTDTNPPADRIAEIKARDDLTAEEQLADNPSLFADQAAARIRAYFPRFPLMKTVGPEIAHDLRDADGHPYALPIIDVIAVLDDLDRTNMAFESQTHNWRRARKERDTALARVEELERQLGKGEEEWAIRVFTRADHKHWFHQYADAETVEVDLAATLSVMANSIDLVTDAPPVNHGLEVVKRTVWASEWETVKTVEATGEPTRAPDTAMDEFEAMDDIDRRWE